MTDLFFGPVAVVGWFLASMVFAFCATYTWRIVQEVGGIRGTALATMCTALAIVCTCFGLILAKQDLIPNFLLGAIVTAAFPPILFAALVLCDLYGADRNGHRSFTARSYLWYKRVTKDEREERNPRHPISIQEHV